MTNVELASFLLGWGLLIHGLYTISPVAMEITLALQFLLMSNPKKVGKQ